MSPSRHTQCGIRRDGLCRPAALVVLVLVLLGLAPTAGANHSVIEQVSTGPSGGNASIETCPLSQCSTLISRDGEHAFFETAESLVSGDTDGTIDVYERSGGTTTLASTGPIGGNGNYFAELRGTVDDGSSVFFSTQEQLVSADTDDYFDVYERSGATTTLVSTAPGTGNGPYAAQFSDTTPDGSHVFFRTQEPLVPADTDDEWDIYDRSGSATTLISIGASGGNGLAFATYLGSSTDGAHVIFKTVGSLVPADADNCGHAGCEDVYERFGGSTFFVSTGPVGGNGQFDPQFAAVSQDGSRVIFETAEQLVAADADSTQNDVYERTGGSTTLVSTGTLASGERAAFEAASVDGLHVFFSTTGRLESNDNDSLRNDVYERFGGSTTLVSTGPGETSTFSTCTSTSGPAIGGPCPVLVSIDGSRVFFSTHESLAAGDSGYLDIYERSGGVTRLVSTGPTDANSASTPQLHDVSEDGLRAIFSTTAQLVPEDPDTRSQIYERFAGATT